MDGAPRVAAMRRLTARTADLRAIQRASSLIVDLGAELDARLRAETRPRERMRMLRETTNRITRTANDAVEAYRRASRAVKAELAKPNADVAAATELQAELRAARLEMLRVLDLASRRYPAPSDEPEADDRPADDEPEADDQPAD